MAKFYNVNLINGHKYIYYDNGVSSFLSPAEDSFKKIEIGADMISDLTQMFGAGFEPDSMEDPRMVAFSTYLSSNQGYNKGENTDQIVGMYKYIQSVDIPITFSCYGVNIGTVSNYIDFANKKYIQNIDVRTYQNGDEFDNDVITDGTNTYYILDEPIETDISSSFQDGLNFNAAPYSLIELAFAENSYQEAPFVYSYDNVQLWNNSKYLLKRNDEESLLSNIGHLSVISGQDKLFDLTRMFGESYIPSLTDKEIAWLHLQSDTYNLGTLINTIPQQVKCGTTTKNIPTTFLGYGWSIGDLSNYIDFTQNLYYRYVEGIDFGTLTWSKMSSGIMVATAPNDMKDAGKLLCSRYINSSKTNVIDKKYDRIMCVSGGKIMVWDSAYTSVDDFASDVHGMLLYYEFAEPDIDDVSINILKFKAQLNQNVQLISVHYPYPKYSYLYHSNDHVYSLSSQHKYLFNDNGVKSIFTNNASLRVNTEQDKLYDLTQMFPSGNLVSTTAQFDSLFSTHNMQYVVSHIENKDGTVAKVVHLDNITSGQITRVDGTWGVLNGSSFTPFNDTIQSQFAAFATYRDYTHFYNNKGADMELIYKVKKPFAIKYTLSG